MTDIDKFVHDQLSVWPQVAARYRELKHLSPGSIPFGSLPESGPCPLCRENHMPMQHTLPFEGRKGRKYDILVNRDPVFLNHLVIARDIHSPQTIWHRFPDMLDLAEQLPNYVVYYSSPAGTSVPGHAHFHAWPKGYIPMERTADNLFRSHSLPSQLELVLTVRDARMYHYNSSAEGVFMLRAQTSKSLAKAFYRLLDCLNLFAEQQEPGFYVLAYCTEGEYRAVVKVEGDQKTLLWRLVRTQPRLEVCIASGEEIVFEVISDGAGPQKVSYREGRIDYGGVLYDNLVFEAKTISTLFAEPSFIIYKDGETLQYAGSLSFVVSDGRVQAINGIGLEDYLVGVLGPLNPGCEDAIEARRKVLADSPQPYRGLLAGIDDTAARIAVDATWGQV